VPVPGAGASTCRPELPADRQLALLAAAVGPLRRVLSAIAARLLASKAFERLCYARLGDYARERAGVSARQLQDLARVHRALVAFPALERALLSNELPWAKVRLVARVATEADVGSWIARARVVPTRRLEHEVRLRSERSRPGEGDAQDLVRIEVSCTPAVLAKWILSRKMAERVTGQRMSAAEALEVVVAEVFSTTGIDPALADAPDEPSRRVRDGPSSSARDQASGAEGPPARDLPCSIAALAAGLDAADAHELDRRLRLAVHLEQTLDAAMAPLLQVVGSPEYEWSGEYQRVPTYAREQLGISPSKARALLRLERAGDVCPEIRDAYRRGCLSWVKAQRLLPLLLLDLAGEWRPAWVAWAERVTLRRLESDVERALLLRAHHPRAWERCQYHPERAQDPIPEGERQVCAPGVNLEATQAVSWRLPREVARVYRGVQETMRLRLRPERRGWLSDGEVFDALLECAILSWSVRDPTSRRPDPVIERDGYRCAVPGCTSRRNLHDHHLVFLSHGGSDAPENRITLCAFHHRRCLHAGLMTVDGRAPDALVFELGRRPGSAPLVRYRSGDVVLPRGAVAPACSLSVAA